MQVTVFSCGEPVNESELKAIECLKNYLKSQPGNDEWVLLCNLAFSLNHQLQSDEIDIVAIGPPGVRVIEVKHWSSNWVDSNSSIVEAEADKLTNKARKIGTTVRKLIPDLSRVDGVFLLTQPPSKSKKVSANSVRGAKSYTLNQWKEVVDLDAPSQLNARQVQTVSRLLAPKSAVAIDGSLRRLAGYVNLELRSPKEDRFHRIYQGSHPSRRDRVVLHLYDISASDEVKADVVAKREFETLHMLQLYRWAPRILDSWQEAPGYAGEMYFFTVVDPAAPTLKERIADQS